jgi:hypothetical protein
MTGLRPLMLCLLALINTAFWAGLLHLVGLFEVLPRGAQVVLLAAVFILSLIVLLSFGAGGADGDASGPSGENGPSAPA